MLLLQVPVLFTHSAPCWPQDAPQRSTWLGGARCVVVACIGSGGGGLDGRRGGPGGGFVNADFGLELWEAPPSVDVLKLLNLGTKKPDANPETHLVSTHRPHAPHTWHTITDAVWHTLQMSNRFPQVVLKTGLKAFGGKTELSVGEFFRLVEPLSR